MLIVAFPPCVLFSTERNKDQSGFSQLDLVVSLKFPVGQQHFAVDVDQSSAFAWAQVERVLLRIKRDDRVPFARDGFIARDADIHVFGTADGVVLAADAVVPPFFRTMVADEPAHHGVDGGQPARFDHLGGSVVSDSAGRANFHSLRAGVNVALNRRTYLDAPRTTHLDPGHAVIGAGRMLLGVVIVSVVAALHSHGAGSTAFSSFTTFFAGFDYNSRSP